MWGLRSTAFVVAACLAAAAAETRAADAAPPRVEVPITQTVLPNGNVRYSLPVSIGGAPPIAAALDTGSFGLRVLARAIAPARYQDTGVERAYPYGSGARLNGPLARAKVAIGEAETPEPILIQVVKTVDCVERKPHCPASRLSPADYGIEGDGYPGQGFDAILGMSLRRAPAAMSAENPLGAMGDDWIVMLPRPGASEPGRLIVNPTAAEVAGFTLIHLERQPARGDGAPGWKDAALAGCLTNEGTARRACGATLLDTGAPGIAVASAAAGGGSSWRAGTRATLAVSGGDQPVAMPFVVGTDVSTGVRVEQPVEGGDDRISAGTLPFLVYAVLFDGKAGLIGFKPRD